MTMQRRAVDGRVPSYWVTFFGLPTLPSAGTTIVPHAGLGDYSGVWFFQHDNALIVSVPPPLLAQYRATCTTITAADIAARHRLHAVLHAAPLRQIGPAWIGYADRTTLRLGLSPHVRRLTEVDYAAWCALREACGALEWEHGGSAWTPDVLAGCFAGDTLVALAGYEVWGDALAHIAVVTHPHQRGCGYGREAVGFLAQQALARGLVPQYRTLATNDASLRVGSALGFHEYAQTVAMRFKEQATP